MAAFGFSLPLLAARRSRIAAGLAMSGVIPAVVASFVDNRFSDEAGPVAFGELLSFERLSSAVMINGSGDRVSLAAGVPRIGHHVNGQNQGLRFESVARTNLITFATTFNAAIWNSSNVTVAKDVTGPDGEAATGTTATITDSGCRLRNTGVAVAENTDYTFTIVARKGSTDTIMGAVYDVSNGAYIVPSFNYATQLDPAEYRDVHIQFKTPPGCTNVFVYLANSGSAPGTVILGGAQVNAGSPASFIPTSGAAVTRAAETLTIPGAKTPDVIRAVFMDGLMTYLDSGVGLSSGGGGGAVLFYMRRASSSAFIQAGLDTQTSRTGQFAVMQRNDGPARADGATDDFSPGVNVPFSIAARHEPALVGGGFGGNALAEVAAPDGAPDLIGQDFEIGPTFNGVIRRVALYVDAVSNSGVEGVTS